MRIATNAGSASNALSCMSGMAISKPRVSPSVRRPRCLTFLEHTASVARVPGKLRCLSGCRGVFSQCSGACLLASVGPSVPLGMCRGWRLWDSPGVSVLKENEPQPVCRCVLWDTATGQSPRGGGHRGVSPRGECTSGSRDATQSDHNTTAAERFFGQKPRSMFAAILESVEIPPAPLSPPQQAVG